MFPKFFASGGTMFSSHIITMIIGASVGALIGFVYQRFHDCGGSCPFSAHPVISMIWGAAIGLMFTA